MITLVGHRSRGKATAYIVWTRVLVSVTARRGATLRCRRQDDSGVILSGRFLHLLPPVAHPSVRCRIESCPSSMMRCIRCCSVRSTVDVRLGAMDVMEESLSRVYLRGVKSWVYVAFMGLGI